MVRLFDFPLFCVRPLFPTRLCPLGKASPPDGGSPPSSGAEFSFADTDEWENSILYWTGYKKEFGETPNSSFCGTDFSIFLYFRVFKMNQLAFINNKFIYH